MNLSYGAVHRALIYAALAFMAILLPVMAHAGGLGMSVLMSIAGIAALLRWPPNLQIPKSVIALAVFLFWVWLSHFWSNYENPKALANYLSFPLGVLLFVGGLRALPTILHSKFKAPMSAFVIIWLLLGLIVLSIDIFTNYAVTFWADPILKSEDAAARRGDAIQNTSHGLTIYVLALAPLMGLFFARAGRPWSLAAGFSLFVCLLAAAGKGSMSAAQLAAVLTFLTFIAALRRPRSVLRMSFSLAAILVLLAPIAGLIASHLGPELIAKIPGSWENRIVNWSYIYEKIAQSPIWGHGFDAARTFNETYQLRGTIEWSIVSLHPHNAGLHIWVETGLVGAVLACAAIYLAYRQAERANLGATRSAALSGLIVAGCVFASLSYGVWQDWYWASFIACGMIIALMSTESLKGITPN